MEKHFIYYHCNQWKMTDSMNVVGVFTEAKLKETIVEDLDKGEIKLDNRDVEEILEMDIRTINSLIEFGHIIEITLNERL